MDYLDQLKKDVAKIQSDMAAWQEKNPTPIAISVSPRGFDILKQRVPASNRESLPFSPLVPLIPFGSVRVYVWSKQSEPIKIYYAYDEFKQWFDTYADPGDVMLPRVEVKA